MASFRPIPLERYDAVRLWRQANRFYGAEEKYRDAQNRESKLKDCLFQARLEKHLASESKIKECLFQAQQEKHLAFLDCMSAGRVMSNILGLALLGYFDDHAD